MEVNKKIFKILMVLMTIFCTIFIFAGCGKKFWDYECVWVSDSPYIYMPADSHKVIIEINGEKKSVDTGWENTGLGIEFCDPDIDNGQTEESIIWETKCKIKNEKLYITIVKDHVSDMEGETIVLEQQPLESESIEE